MKRRKLLQKLLAGSKNVRFSEASSLAEAFGFKLDRVSGSHHIYIHPHIPDLINLQNVEGKAKPYQIKQLLKIIEQYDLHMEDDE
jgi:predicted RNA binding protein YcfA (HicA-like mRNA interferase family)